MWCRLVAATECLLCSPYALVVTPTYRCTAGTLCLRCSAALAHPHLEAVLQRARRECSLTRRAVVWPPESIIRVPAKDNGCEMFAVTGSAAVCACARVRPCVCVVSVCPRVSVCVCVYQVFIKSPKDMPWVISGCLKIGVGTGSGVSNRTTPLSSERTNILRCTSSWLPAT